MSDQVVLKKADGEFFAFIPALGIVERAAQAEAAYDKALARKLEVETTFKSCNALHLLEQQATTQLEVKVWSSRFKQWMLISLVLYFTGLAILGFVLKRSIDRMTASVQMSVLDPDPKRIEKNAAKFRELLAKYRPFIQEWNRAFAEGDKK